MTTFKGVRFSEDTYPLHFTYRNWQGEVADRRARPVRMFFGLTEWHPEPQWLLEAIDLDKQQTRVFAMRDMLGLLP